MSEIETSFRSSHGKFVAVAPGLPFVLGTGDTAEEARASLLDRLCAERERVERRLCWVELQITRAR